MTLRPATHALVNGRCSLGRVSRKYARTTKGRVIGQTPKAGAHAPAGSTVALVLSRGRRPR
jgi:beta-lactam-binding protein with PASTA domain